MTVYQQTSSAGGSYTARTKINHSGSTRINGQVGQTGSVLLGLNFTKIELYGYTQNMTGTQKIECVVIRGGSVVHTFWTANGVDYDASDSWMGSIETTTPYSGLQADDLIGLQIKDDVDNSGATIKQYYADVTTYADTHLGNYRSWSYTSVDIETGKDVTFRFTTGAVSSSGARLPPPPIVLGGL